MLYTKYESPGPCSFRQEDFWQLHFENLFFDPVTYLCNHQNHLNNFCKGPPKDHSCWVLSSSHQRFKRRSRLIFSLYNSMLSFVKFPLAVHNLNNFGRRCYMPNMKALGLVVSDKKIFLNCILQTYFLTLWPTNATNWNNLNNFGRGPPRDHSREVW